MEKPKWVSVGYPTIVNDSNGHVFHFTAEYVAVKIKTLDSTRKNALLNQAKLQYPSQNISAESIIPLPLTDFSCSVSSEINDTNYAIRGDVYDLRTNPLILRFRLGRRNRKRVAFQERILNQDPLYFECETAATGKQEKANTLIITAGQLQELGLAAKLFGPAEERYVVRQQLAHLAQEIKRSLQIEENYELENEDFTETFIQQMMQGTPGQFQPVPFDEALAGLSKYGVSSDNRDLSPTEVKKELSDIFQIKTEGGKQHIVAQRGDSGSFSSGFDLTSTAKGGGSGLFKLASVNFDTSFIMGTQSALVRNISSVDDPLRELNQHSQSAIKWAREGNRIIPKSLDVVKISRMTLNHQLSFSRIKKRLSNAKYSRRHKISIQEASTDQLKVSTPNNLGRSFLADICNYSANFLILVPKHLQRKD